MKINSASSHQPVSQYFTETPDFIPYKPNIT